MQTINFGGIQAEVLALSPHQSYFIFRLSARIALKGIYTSQFTWDETTDNLAGFLSKHFVLYVGVNSYDEAEFIKDTITKAGGTPNEDVSFSRFVRGYPHEVRAIGLSPEYLVQTLQHYPHPHSA